MTCETQNADDYIARMLDVFNRVEIRNVCGRVTYNNPCTCAVCDFGNFRNPCYDERFPSGSGGIHEPRPVSKFVMGMEPDHEAHRIAMARTFVASTAIKRHLYEPLYGCSQADFEAKCAELRRDPDYGLWVEVVEATDDPVKNFLVKKEDTFEGMPHRPVAISKPVDRGEDWLVPDGRKKHGVVYREGDLEKFKAFDDFEYLLSRWVSKLGRTLVDYLAKLPRRRTGVLVYYTESADIVRDLSMYEGCFDTDLVLERGLFPKEADVYFYEPGHFNPAHFNHLQYSVGLVWSRGESEVSGTTFSVNHSGSGLADLSFVSTSKTDRGRPFKRTVQIPFMQYLWLYPRRLNGFFVPSVAFDPPWKKKNKFRGSFVLPGGVKASRWGQRVGAYFSRPFKQVSPKISSSLYYNVEERPVAPLPIPPPCGMPTVPSPTSLVFVAHPDDVLVHWAYRHDSRGSVLIVHGVDVHFIRTSAVLPSTQFRVVAGFAVFRKGVLLNPIIYTDSRGLVVTRWHGPQPGIEVLDDFGGYEIMKACAYFKLCQQIPDDNPYLWLYPTTPGWVLQGQPRCPYRGSYLRVGMPGRRAIAPHAVMVSDVTHTSICPAYASSGWDDFACSAGLCPELYNY